MFDSSQLLLPVRASPSVPFAIVRVCPLPPLTRDCTDSSICSCIQAGNQIVWALQNDIYEQGRVVKEGVAKMVIPVMPLDRLSEGGR